MKKVSKKANSLTDVDASKFFYLSDGRILRNLKELGNALTDMNEGTYYYHANESKNDFSNWLRDVLNEKILAKTVAKLNRADALNKIIKRINVLEKKK